MRSTTKSIQILTEHHSLLPTTYEKCPSEAFFSVQIGLVSVDRAVARRAHHAVATALPHMPSVPVGVGEPEVDEVQVVHL